MTRERWHGTAGGYTNHACRCSDCRRAWAENHRIYMAAHPEQRARHREYMRRRRASLVIERADDTIPAQVSGDGAAQTARPLTDTTGGADDG